jgi:hypothetical protein
MQRTTPGVRRGPGSVSESPDDVAYEFEAGRHTFRASVSQFRGATYLDLREWYEPEPGKPLKPTRKGISVPVEYLDELREAVEALATVAGGDHKRARARSAS